MRVGGKKGVKVTDAVQVAVEVMLGVGEPPRLVRLGVTVLAEGGWVVLRIPGVGVTTLRKLMFSSTTMPTQ